MTHLLIRIFVRNSDDIHNLSVRKDYGTLSSMVGIVANIFLFTAKLVIGTIANSIAITSDAFNNLSDMASCVFTLVGYRLAAKPADEDHPFGHGRIEYLVSLVVASVILFVGAQFFFSSVEKIFFPEAVVYSHIAALVLVLSMATKLWLSAFNRTLGLKIKSHTMLATAQDSKSDVWATLSTFVALLASLFTDLPIDGVMGVVVSILILKAGFGIIKETVDTLIGAKVDEGLASQILEMVLASPSILGAHDLVVHNYGPGRMMASIHAEVPSDCNLMQVHDEIDGLERRLLKELNVHTVIHMDPIEVNNQINVETKALVETKIKEIHADLSIHDFRMVNGETNINLIFDMVIPSILQGKEQQIKSKLEAALQQSNPAYQLVITFDHQYM
ncbi:MAG: cation diffusion facilitator family transporter [Erysipelotrichaceae bacterium]